MTRQSSTRLGEYPLRYKLSTLSYRYSEVGFLRVSLFLVSFQERRHKEFESVGGLDGPLETFYGYDLGWVVLRLHYDTPL